MKNSQSIETRLKNIEALLLSQKVVFTFGEVAIYTGLSKSYLYKLTSAGKIPFSKPQGKVIFFEKKLVDEWLLQNKAQTAEEIEAQAATHVALKQKNK